MIEGIANLIIKQIVSKIEQKGKIDIKKKNIINEISTKKIDLNFDLEELNIKGLDDKKTKTVNQLIKKLIKDSNQDELKLKMELQKTIPIELEKKLNRYLTDNEKDLVGILINKLV